MNRLSANSKLKSIVASSSFAPAIFMLIVSGMTGEQTTAASLTAEFQEIQGLFEPSGVVQLDDGRVLAVEDEPTKPFVLLTPNPGVESFSLSYLRSNVLFHSAMGHVSDLEGVTKESNGLIYAITSQSRKGNGKRDPEREKIIQFSIDGDRLLSSHVRTDFRKKLVKAFPALKDAAKERDVKNEGGLNIEGLTFSPDGNKLWVGLRAPLSDDMAILVAVLNPRSALEARETFRFTKSFVLLDLDGGGIRDIAYDPILSGYLILSQRENTKNEKAFKLWLWNGNPKIAPRRVRIRDIKKLKSTEGIAPVRLNGKDQLLLLNDDGNRNKAKPASYILLDYTQLEIEATR